MAKSSNRTQFSYEFEQPILELDEQIRQLKEQATEADSEDKGLADRIVELEAKRDELLQDIVANLTPYQRVRLARHPLRPQSRDYIERIFDDFIELRGDRHFGDDKAVITGLARLKGRRLMLIAQQKGKETREKMEHNFGMPQPEGYRKALAKMGLAEKFSLPVVCMIDTPGAAPALEAEERGQAMAIAENIFSMTGLRTPIVVIIVGEGCSGGALGIGVGDRLAMLENAYYSVISPEGCAAILWKNSDQAEKAAEAMKLTARDMLELGIIEDIVKEPLGGAHRDIEATAANIETYLDGTLEELEQIPLDRLLEERYQRYRQLGQFTTA